MKKVKWQWDMGVDVPFCPYCDEPAYEKDHCAFCGKKYKWVEGKHKPTVVEYGDYRIIQCTNNHIQVYKNNQIVMYSSCTKKLTEEELKAHVDFVRSIREGGGT